MKSYIKLLSAALLVAGATTQVSAMDAEFAKFRAHGLTSSTIHGGHVAAALSNMGVGADGLPETAVVKSFASKYRAWEEAHPIAGGGGSSSSINLTDINTFMSSVSGTMTVYPALAFAGAAKRIDPAVTAKFTKSYRPIKTLDGFKDLKDANLALLSHVVTSVLNDADLETSINNVAADKLPIGAFATDTDVLTKASLAKPYDALAGLITKRYNASVRGLKFHDGSSAVSDKYDDENLPTDVIAQLSNEISLNAYVLALHTA